MNDSKDHKAAAEPSLDCRVMPLPLGTETQWGTIEMVGLTGGERYYWMVNRLGGKSAGVSMIPAFMVEAEHNVTRRASALSLLTDVLADWRTSTTNDSAQPF